MLLLTHDADRYADELWWRAARPELELGRGKLALGRAGRCLDRDLAGTRRARSR
jgi:hypothetical protein